MELGRRRRTGPCRPTSPSRSSYADAADLSRGTLSPAEALAAGRVRVRGDLSVLVAAQQALAAAADLLGPLQAATTY